MQSKLIWIFNLINMNMPWMKSEFWPTSSLGFSLTTNEFGYLLDILESLQHYLHSIFEMQFEMPSGTMWKMAMKIGQNPAKLGQNFTKLKVSWTLVPKIITWYPSLFLENFVNQSCRLCGVIQLSCWKFCFNPIASWWKNGTKLGKNKKIS